MALSVINLYSTWSMSHSGTKDTGKGVGFKHSPSTLFATYNQLASNPPNGWALYTGSLSNAADVFVYGSKIFFCCNSAYGIGRSVIGYDLNVSGDQAIMAYDQYAGLASILSGGNQWPATWYYEQAAVFESPYVYLCVYTNSGSGNTPVLGKWDCNNWPFTSGNAEWLSPLQQNWASYIAGQMSNGFKIFVGDTYVWCSSAFSGQVSAIDKNTGSVAGNWVSYAAYSSIPQYSFSVLGENNGKPVGGSRYTPGSNKDLNLWDASNLNSWSLDTQLLANSLDNTYTMGNQYGRANKQMNRYSQLFEPLDKHELSLINATSNQVAWWQSGYTYDRLALIVLDVSTKAYNEKLLGSTSVNRSVGDIFTTVALRRFVEIDGYTWFVTFSTADLDQENEDPGGSVNYHGGLRATPIGPVSCTFSAAGIAGTPKKILLEQDSTATNFGFALDPAKHRFRYKLNAAAWSDWRCGQTELHNLDSVINGKTAWSAYTGSDTVYIEHQICAGWPYDWLTVQGNPGGGSDPTTPNLGCTNCGPPRDVLPMFVCDVVGGGSYTFKNIKPGLDKVVSLQPSLNECYEVP